ncbi:MAG: bifunctional DNA-formamidopyrimidine glycosylase/DNA-(apurinic or apyrimidinic site) lyase [Phycisphaerae bacterium]
MPELPEVESVVRTLRPHCQGRRVSHVTLRRRDVLTPPELDWPSLLQHRRIADVRRRGKRIVFSLDDANRFFVHLGMTGRLLLADADTPEPPHTHLLLHLDAGRQVRFIDPRRFGGVTWLGRRVRDASLGPEPLGLPPGELARRLAGTRRAVKAALLDQKLVAGLGNIYVDEALHRAGIHPLTPADRLDGHRIRKLSRAVKYVLRRAIAAGGSSIRDYVDADGVAGAGVALHRVYGRAGQPCLTCRRATVEKFVLAQRGTHVCTNCQRQPA